MAYGGVWEGSGDSRGMALGATTRNRFLFQYFLLSFHLLFWIIFLFLFLVFCFGLLFLVLVSFLADVVVGLLNLLINERGRNRSA